MLIGKTFTFNAAHFLPNHPKCGQVHGHTWLITPVVRGWLNPETGMVVDLHEFSEDIRWILEKFDHKLINDSLQVFPTCENLAVYIFEQLHVTYEVYEVKVQEGPDGGFAIANGV
jgi:6-pyruvoyltetrahydropterin/6-carboxytetrahydropterin synthase